MTATTSKLGADTMDQKTQMREGFEAQRKAGMNVDWFTWQIAWHDALFTVHDIAGDALARQPAAIDKQEAVEGYAFRSDGKLWVVTDPVVAMKWQKQGFEVTPVNAAPLDKEASKPAAPMPAFNPLARMASGPELQERLRIISSKSMDAECSRLVDEEFFNLIDGAAPSVEQDERGAFEVALKRGVFDVDRVSDFNNCETEAAWRGWQARAASSANVAQGAEAVAIKCASDYASMTSGSQQPCDAPNCDCVPPEPTYYWRDAAGNCYGADPQPTLYAWKAPVQAPPAQTALTDDARDLFIRDIAQQKPEKPDHWNSCRQCEHNIERAQDILTAAQSASGDTK